MFFFFPPWVFGCLLPPAGRSDPFKISPNFSQHLFSLTSSEVWTTPHAGRMLVSHRHHPSLKQGRGRKSSPLTRHRPTTRSRISEPSKRRPPRSPPSPGRQHMQPCGHTGPSLRGNCSGSDNPGETVLKSLTWNLEPGAPHAHFAHGPRPMPQL